MRKTLTEIARIVDGKVVGDGDLVIRGLCGIQEGKEGNLTFRADPKYLSLAQKCKASAIIVPRAINVPDKSIILSEDPSRVFAKVVALFASQVRHFQGLHRTSFITKTASLGKNVAIGPYVIVEDRVTIGDDTVIYSGTFLGHDTTIGSRGL